MARTPPPIERLRSFISRQQVVTISDLMRHLDRSRATAFRLLTQIEHITSYNQNRTGITLLSTPKFDSWGLWNFKKFYFSKWTNLNETIQNVVDKSPAGLYPRELQDILSVRIHNHLSMCVTKNGVVRNNEFGHPIYFSKRSEQRQKQYEERTKIVKKRKPYEKPPLSNENIIKVLLVIIEHHATTVGKVMPVLETKGIQFSERSIRWLFNKYQIEKKGSP